MNQNADILGITTIENGNVVKSMLIFSKKLIKNTEIHSNTGKIKVNNKMGKIKEVIRGTKTRLLMIDHGFIK